MVNALGTATLYLETDNRGLIQGIADARTRTVNALERIGRDARLAGLTLSAAISAPLIGITGLALKSQIDFEAAFVNIRKNISGTTQEFNNLEQGIRSMAKEIPSSAVEISNVAATAAKLGIPIQGLQQFTRTAIDLGNVTSLTADQAATGLARLEQVMGLTVGQTSNLGSVIVALGRSGASTESDIVNMTLRLAGAARVAGATAQEVLGLSNGLSSLGLSAEVGGSAFSRVFQEVSIAVTRQGAELDAFATATGKTREEFLRLASSNPTEAVLEFLSALDGVRQTGGDVYKVLDNIGLSNIRISSAVLRASQNVQFIRDQINLSNDAWQKNNALVDAAGQFYGTAQSRLKIFWNQLVDTAITLGGALVPALFNTLNALQPFIGGVEDLVKSFANLPAPVQTAILIIGGLAVAMGPVLFALGSFITVVTPVITFIKGLTLANQSLAGSFEAVEKAQRNAAPAFAEAARAQANVAAVQARNAESAISVADQRASQAQVRLQQAQAATQAAEARLQVARTTAAARPALATLAREKANVAVQAATGPNATPLTLARADAAQAEAAIAERKAQTANQQLLGVEAQVRIRQEAERARQAEYERAVGNTDLVRAQADARRAEAIAAQERANIAQARVPAAGAQRAAPVQPVPNVPTQVENIAGLQQVTTAENTAASASEARMAVLAAEARVVNLTTEANNANFRALNLESVASAESARFSELRTAAVSAAAKAADLRIAASEADQRALALENSFIIQNGRARDVATKQFINGAERQAAAEIARTEATQLAAEADQAEAAVLASRAAAMEAYDRAQAADIAATQARQSANERVAAIGAAQIAADEARATAQNVSTVATEANTVAAGINAVAVEANVVAVESATTAELLSVSGLGLAAGAWRALSGAVIGATAAFAANPVGLAITAVSIVASIFLWNKLTAAMNEAKHAAQDEAQAHNLATKLSTTQLQGLIDINNRNIASLTARRDALQAVRDEIQKYSEVTIGESKDLQQVNKDLDAAQRQSKVFSDALGIQADATAAAKEALEGLNEDLAVPPGEIGWITALTQQFKDLESSALLAKIAVGLVQAEQGGAQASPEALAGLTPEDAQALLTRKLPSIEEQRQQAGQAFVDRLKQEIDALDEQLKVLSTSPEAKGLSERKAALQEQLSGIINPTKGQGGLTDSAKYAATQRQQEQAEALFKSLPGFTSAQEQLAKIQASSASEVDKVTQQWTVLDALWNNEAIPALQKLGLATDDTFHDEFDNAVKAAKDVSQFASQRQDAITKALIQDLPGIKGVEAQFKALGERNGSHLDNIKDQFKLLDQFWISTVIPGLQAAGISVNEGARTIFEGVASNVDQAAKDVLGSLNGLFAAFAVRRLSLGLDPGAGLFKFNAGAFNTGTTASPVQHVQYINEVNVGVRPDIPGGIDAPRSTAILKQAFAEAVP